MENGYFVISLDFELYWGLHDSMPPDMCSEAILNVHKVVPGLLSLFEKYGIHATWATVGGIMAKDKSDWLRYTPDVMPEYAVACKSAYSLTDNIGTEGYPDRLFFAPELVDMVRRTPGQELGSHTFSHYYCLDEGAALESFASDLVQAAKIAADFGVSAPTSAVLPKNQVNAALLSVLKDAGIIAYRGVEDNWIHNKVKREQLARALRLLNNYLPITGSDSFTVTGPEIPGLYNVKASRFLRPYSGILAILEPLKLLRIKAQMRKAAKRREIYHLWWHPHNFGNNTDQNLRMAEKLFSYFRKLNAGYGMQSAHMTEVCRLSMQE